MAVFGAESENGTSASNSAGTSSKLSKRFDEVKRLQAELKAEGEELILGQDAHTPQKQQKQKEIKDERQASKSVAGDNIDDDRHNTYPSLPTLQGVRIPSELRRAKLQQVQAMLERETALVDAVSARLERLQVGSV